MMTYTITPPKQFDAAITLPASKSISNRALVIHMLSHGPTLPDNLSDCDDTEVMVRALKIIRGSEGAREPESKNRNTPSNHSPQPTAHDSQPITIDIGAAGTSMRFMTALLSVLPGDGDYVLTGTERMKHRPIGVLVNALRSLGADISYVGEEGYPPLQIHSRQLEGGRLEVPGNISSQYISALLLIGPSLQQGLELTLTGNIISRPYIDLTLHIMHQFGCHVEWTDIDTISVSHQHYGAPPYVIENDWSAASYWYEILALSRNTDTRVLLPGLYDSSRQGDSAVRYIFSLLGVKTQFVDGGALLTYHPGVMPHLDYDFTNQPDLAQTVVVTCCALDIKFHFTGLSTLKIKETDRIEALKTELRKLGYVVHDINGSELQWDGERCEPLSEPAIDTYEDHRMALAFAPLAVTRGSIRINNPHVVSKSYPHYWEDLQHVGFRVVGNP